jgi:hypothetical protein
VMLILDLSVSRYGNVAASKLFNNMSWGIFFLYHSFFTVQLNGCELYGDAYIFL